MGNKLKRSFIYLFFAWNLIPAISAYAQINSPHILPGQFFFVKTIRIEGNTLLPDRKLDELLINFTNQSHTMATLEKAANLIQQSYRDAGYGGVVAYLPEQVFEQSEIVIKVLEGKLEHINISGNKYLEESNILSSLPKLIIGNTPVVKDIDRNIQMANENPGKKLNITLLPGIKLGAINADIKVTEEKSLRLLFGLDSAGTPGTGNFRVSAGIQHTNLWNRDHIGTFQFQTSPTDPGHTQVYSAGYRIPLYDYLSAVDLIYAFSNIDSTTSATPISIGPIGFIGKGHVAGIRAHRFLSRLGEYDHRLTIGWDWRHFDNHCDFRGIVNACGRVNADITIAPLSIGYTGQLESSKFSWGFHTNLSGNLAGSSNSNFDIARHNAEKQYAVWRFFGFSNLNFSTDFTLSKRVTTQYTPFALVPGEQFGLGGGGSAMGGIISVRGYREREVVGDYGIAFNLEGLGPDIASYIKSESISIRPLAFFDIGWVGNNHHMDCNAHSSSCALAGIGGGLRFKIGKQFSGRLDLGQALIDGNLQKAGDMRGHLAINIHY